MFRWPLLLSLCALGAIGCVTPSAQRVPVDPRMEAGFAPDPGPSTSSAQAPEGRGSLLAQWATTFVGLKSLRQVTHSMTDDCSGFVRFVYQRQGIDLYPEGFLPGENGVSAIYRRARAAGVLHREDPQPGDLVFFHDTYDRNHDGRLNDGLTHIGIVESVDGDGTVTFIHRHGPGVGRSRLNPSFPGERHGPDGRVFNDYLRRATRYGRAYLAGELFSGYASPDGL